MGNEITLILTGEEALVLFELLSRHFENNQPLAVEHLGETAALSALLGRLESILVEPFESDYREKVERARLSLAERLGDAE